MSVHKSCVPLDLAIIFVTCGLLADKEGSGLALLMLSKSCLKLDHLKKVNQKQGNPNFGTIMKRGNSEMLSKNRTSNLTSVNLRQQSLSFNAGGTENVISRAIHECHNFTDEQNPGNTRPGCITWPRLAGADGLTFSDPPSQAETGRRPTCMYHF